MIYNSTYTGEQIDAAITKTTQIDTITSNINTINGQITTINSTLSNKPNKPIELDINIGTTWEGSASPYTQAITLDGYTVTSNTRVILELEAAAYTQMSTDNVKALYIKNTDGVLYAYAIDSAPTVALTIKGIVYEVS